MTVTEFPQHKIAALHGHLRLHGRLNTASIARAVLGENLSEHKDGQLEKLLLREADKLDIEPVQGDGDGLYWRRREKTEPEPQPAPASIQPAAKTKAKKPAAKAKPAAKPADKRNWSLNGELMKTARQIARELGAQGVVPSRGNLPTAELARRLGERIGCKLPDNAFAPSSVQFGGKWRENLEEHYQEGRKDHLAKMAEFREAKEAGEEADAAPSILAPAGPLPEPEQPEPALTPAQLVEAITELQEIVCSSTNGNGSHPPDDEPTDEDLSLVEEVARLEEHLEEAKREIDSLHQRLGESEDRIAFLEEEPTDQDLSLVEEVAQLKEQLEEAKREIESLQRRAEEVTRLEQRLQESQDRVALLEAIEAASKAVDVQTPQPAPQGTLQGVLDALEAQLSQAKDEQTEAQWRLNEAAETVADLSEKLVAARQLVQVLEG